MVVDTSGIIYFIPIIAFMLVAFLIYAVFLKMKLIESPWANAFVALLIAVIFITVAGSVDYVRYITGWIAMLIVSLVFILMIIGLFGGDKKLISGVGIGFMVVGILIFLISGLVVYGNYIKDFFPGGESVNGNTPMGSFTGWFYSSQVFGAVLLLVVSALVAWILAKSK